MRAGSFVNVHCGEDKNKTTVIHKEVQVKLSKDDKKFRVKKENFRDIVHVCAISKAVTEIQTVIK